MKECDNSKIHISSNFILSISLLIMCGTLLLRPTLHCNTPLHFTTLHSTTLHHTSPNYTSPHFTQLHLTTLHPTTLRHTSPNYTSPNYTSPNYTSPNYTSPHFTQHIAQVFLEWEIFQTNVVEKVKTHILCSIHFFKENRAVYEIMW